MARKCESTNFSDVLTIVYNDLFFLRVKVYNDLLYLYPQKKDLLYLEIIPIPKHVWFSPQKRGKGMKTTSFSDIMETIYRDPPDQEIVL